MLQQRVLLEGVLRQDRAIVLTGLLVISALSWAYMVYLAQNMSDMMIPVNQSWRFGDIVFQYVMWTVMMVAMMVPTAAPMILLITRVQRERNERSRPYVSTALFMTGYVLVWSGFAAIATLGQWSLHSGALLSPMMQSTNSFLGGTLLVGAGLFQFSPLKRMCLTQCRSPLGFILTEWREGIWGSLRMGFKHGYFCVGCCWMLMTLLFVSGVMSLLWMALIAGFVLLEKALQGDKWVSRISGCTLITLAVWNIAVSLE